MASRFSFVHARPSVPMAAGTRGQAVNLPAGAADANDREPVEDHRT